MPRGSKPFSTGMPMGIAPHGQNPLQQSQNMGIGSQGGPLFSPTTPQFGQMPVGMMMQTRMQKIGVQKPMQNPRGATFHAGPQSGSGNNAFIPARKKNIPQLF
ncbi:MAG: hypothetical protein NVS9B9_10260 [Ktedonobacteraceae bacterium]